MNRGVLEAKTYDQIASLPRTVLQGRYLGEDELVQIVQPSTVMDELLQTILSVRRYILIAVGVIAIAMLATMILVFLLSLQLRRREMETITKIGGSRARIVSLVAAEVLNVIVTGALLAGLLSLATIWLATSATWWLVQIVENCENEQLSRNRSRTECHSVWTDWHSVLQNALSNVKLPA